MIIKDDNDTRYDVTIAPFDELPNMKIIRIRKPHTAYDGEHENDALVSWSAIGDVTPDEAGRFANAVVEAVKIARRLNAEHDPIESAKLERERLDRYAAREVTQ